MGKLIIVSGASGTGKTYLLQHKDDLNADLHIVKKLTTRSPRQNEDDYEFRFCCDVNEILACDCHYSFRNQMYGFYFADIQNILDNGHNAIMVVRSIESIDLLKKIFNNTVAILCMVNSTAIAEQQLRKNSASNEEIKLRLYSAFEDAIKKEYMNGIAVFDKIIRNNYDEKFLDDVRKYLQSVFE